MKFRLTDTNKWILLNVIGFDIRITPTVDLVEFEKMIEEWCKEAGSDVTYEFLQVDIKFTNSRYFCDLIFCCQLFVPCFSIFQKFTGNTITPIDDKHPWWKAFTNAANEM